MRENKVNANPPESSNDRFILRDSFAREDAGGIGKQEESHLQIGTASRRITHWLNYQASCILKKSKQTQSRVVWVSQWKKRNKHDAG